MNDDYKTLINAAIAAREKAYAPYSAFKVGAALLDESGNVHTGCNVENSAYPLGFCAEANAIGSMINSGAYLIHAIVVVGGRRESPEPCTPCGGCRQRIAEFSMDETVLLMLDNSGAFRRLSVAELLPNAFRGPSTRTCP